MSENFEKFNTQNEATHDRSENETENKHQEYDNAFVRTTISVKEIIPEINADGLTLKGSKIQDTSVNPFTDSAEKRELVHLPSELVTAFAQKLYTPEKWWGAEAEKSQVEGSQEIEEAINEIFKDQVVVDLGSGLNVYGYLIADRAGAKGYVAVEPVFAHDLLYNLTDTLNPELDNGVGFRAPTKPKHKLNKIPIAIVEEDMLSFLKRLPDNSVSVLNSGVDRIVMPNKAYRNNVAQEIMRVMSPEGGYIGQRRMHIELPESESIIETTMGNKDEKHFPYEGIHVYKKAD